MSDFMVRYAKVSAVEPMQPAFDAAAMAEENARWKVHLDGGQELIVNRATAEDIMRVLKAANTADSYWWQQGEADAQGSSEPEHTRVADLTKGREE